MIGWKHIRLFCGLCMVFLTLASCWSVTEVNNLAIVNLLAVDQNDAGEVEVTAVIVKPQAIFSQQLNNGDDGEQHKFYN